MTAAAGTGTGLGTVWAVADRVTRGWRAGDEPDAAAALAAHPELAGHRSVVIELAYQEFLLREKAGDVPDPGAFAARFPDFRDSVRNMLDAHRLLAKRPELLDRVADGWPEVGTWVEGLELAAELGRGAFGRAYLAFDPGTDRFCVLKLAPGGAAEARLIGRLAHPHVTDVYWARSVGGRTAVCMPFLGAATLAEVISRAFPGAADGRTTTAGVILAAAEADGLAGQADRRSAPVVRADEPYLVGACAVGARIADAVAYLHARGVVHGDLKPSNVVIGPGGAPHLIDFNLAAGDIDPAAAVRGTPAYMAPELIDAALGVRPAAGIDGRRADLFALGVVVFELLTGRHPYRPGGRGGLADLAAAARRGPPEMPDTIPATVAAVVAACLAPDPRHRPASAEVVAAALGRYVTGRRTCGRRRGLAAVLACVAVLCSLSPAGLSSPHTPDTATRASRGPVVERPPQTADEFFARGLELLRTGDLNGARADFITAHGRSGDPKALGFAAYCFALSGQALPAADIGRRAIQDGADSAEVRNTVGYGLIQASWPGEAVPHLDEALRLSPNMQAALYNRALARHQLATAPGGKPDLRAAEDIKAALAAGPPFADLHFDAAQIYAVCSALDSTLCDAAIDQLCEAALAGKDPVRFRKDFVLLTYLGKHPRFEAACRTPRGPSPANSIQFRLVEPRP